MRIRLILWCGLACLALAMPLRLAAQVSAGTITGVVTDSADAVIQNAQVTVLNEGTGIQLQTVTNTTGFLMLTTRFMKYAVSASTFVPCVTTMPSTLSSAPSSCRRFATFIQCNEIGLLVLPSGSRKSSGVTFATSASSGNASIQSCGASRGAHSYSD